MHGPLLDDSTESVPGSWTPLSRWWTRPAGGAEVLRVAAPLVASSVSWTALTFIDRVFLKWESGESMSAAFGASAAWFAVLCLPLGICAYVNTFVAQYHGDEQPRMIGPAAWQGVYVALLSTPLLAAAVWGAPLMFGWAEHAPHVTDLEVRYFRIVCYGGLGMWIAQSLSCIYSGRGLTWVNMWIDAAFAGVNAVLDYCWIFGHFGFPALGIEGAAWATTVSLWLKGAFYLALVLRARNRRELGTDVLRFDPELFRRLLRFGAPSGAQMLLDVSGFTVFILMMGKLGPSAAEATALAFSVNMVAFMPIWGIGMGGSILVGQHLGENRDDLAARATSTAMVVACVYAVAIALLYVAAPGWFLDPFFAGSGGADDAGIYATATRLLWFVAAYTVFDAVQLVYVCTLKGAGDTRYIMLVSLAMAALLASSAWLAVTRLGVGIYGCWTLIIAWLLALAVLYFLRYRAGHWRSMRVIEMIHAPQ
ncbi:MAG: MATE family efflux transporter [Pirellulales bacterium]|nr:MATE family efflux transporter [Pirellulales bacterium]